LEGKRIPIGEIERTTTTKESFVIGKVLSIADPELTLQNAAHYREIVIQDDTGMFIFYWRKGDSKYFDECKMKIGRYYYIKSFCSTWGNRNSTLESTPATRIADVTKDIFEACGEKIFLNGEPIWTTSAHFEPSKTTRKYPNVYGLIRSYAKDPKPLPTGILAREGTFKDKDSEAIEFSLFRDQIKLDLPATPEAGPFPIVFIGASIKRYNEKWQVSARHVLFNTNEMATPNFFRDTNLDYVMVNHETQEAWTANYTRIRASEIPNILNNLKPNERKPVEFLAIFEDVDLAGSGIYHGCSRPGCSMQVIVKPDGGIPFCKKCRTQYKQEELHTSENRRVRAGIKIHANNFRTTVTLWNEGVKEFATNTGKGFLYKSLLSDPQAIRIDQVLEMGKGRKMNFKGTLNMANGNRNINIKSMEMVRNQ